MTRNLRERESCARIPAASRRLFLAAGSAAAVFGSLTAARAKAKGGRFTHPDPVLKALAIYAEAHAVDQACLEEFCRIERDHKQAALGGPEFEAEREAIGYNVADRAAQEAGALLTDAHDAVMAAAPTTHEGAIQLALFMARMGDAGEDVDFATASRHLADWIRTHGEG